MDKSIFHQIHRTILECKEINGTILNLANLELTTIPKEIEECYWIEKLYLNDNAITKIENLKGLTELKELYLNNNLITQIENLTNLNSLKGLYLNDNKIEKIENLDTLLNLDELYLNNNLIAKIEGLEKLEWLSSISLNNNLIGTLGNNIQSQLTNIKEINLNFNKISSLKGIETLKKLQEISLNSNEIISIDNLSGLSNLNRISLSRNKIEDVVPFLQIFLQRKKSEIVFKDLFMPSLGEANLGNNPIKSPPLEIIIQNNKKELREHIQKLNEQGKTYFYEAKLLIVGKGGAGKTTLAWKLKDINSPMPRKEEDRTRGIEVQGVEIENNEREREAFKMNVWDFGGQEIYHSTHQFFLTKRSLYIIVNNTRTNETDFNYWLQKIELFSDSSPVLIAQNEEGGTSTDFDLRGFQQYFSNIEGVLDADFSKPNERLKKVIKKVHNRIQELDHLGSKLPKSWVTIRNELNILSNSKPTINSFEFIKICEKHGIEKKEERKPLASFLHDIGAFLYFQNDSILKNIIILNNTWATKGVYRILDNKKIEAQKGQFSEKEAKEIWSDTPFEDWHDELLQLMKKFELCYQVPYINTVQFVAPQLLPKQKPIYNWDESKNLHIYYDYDFLPNGIISKLIVRLYRYIKDIDSYAWQSGCLFILENTEAQVIETYGNKQIEVKVKGAHKKRLSTIIQERIDELNDSFERIKVKKMIPCNCKDCIGSEKPYYYQYDDLLTRKEKFKKTIECSFSYEIVNVFEILDGVYEKIDLKEDINDNEPTIKDLIQKDNLEEALILFERNNRKVGTILIREFRSNRNSYLIGVLTSKEWSTIRSQISYKLLELSDIIE